MRDNFQKLEEIFNNYLLRLLNLQEDIVRAYDLSHPNQKTLIGKIEHSKNSPKRRKDKVIKRLYKKLDKNRNESIWFIKSRHSLDQDNVDDYIEVIRKEENLKGKEFKRFKLWMKGSTSKKFNPYDILYSYFKIGIIVAFTLFEAFNNEIIGLLKNISIEQQLQGIGIHSVEGDLKKELNKLFKIKIENDLNIWIHLVHFHQVRNLLIHRDGQIDDYYMRKVKELGMEHNNFQVGDYILIEKNTFLDVIVIIRIYFEYILKKIENNINLDQKN